MRPPKGTRAHCTDCGRTWDDPRGHTRACRAGVGAEHMEGCRCPECDPDFNDPRTIAESE